MKTKQVLALALAAVMASSVLAGCGSSSSSSSSDSTSSTTDSSASEAASSDASTAASAATESGTRTVTLSDGYVVTGVPEEPTRIAALFGPSYERLYVLNAEDKIVMCSSFHQTSWPWSHLIYQRVDDPDMIAIENSNQGLNVEDLVAEDIDVCFYWSTQDVLDSLNNVGIAAVPYNTSGTMDSIKDELYAYAQVLNTDEAMAIYEDYADYFDSKIDQISSVVETIPDDEKVTVYFAMRDLLASGMNGDILEAVKTAGGIPVTEDETAGSTGSNEIDKEQLVAWNPDYIFLDHAASSSTLLQEELFSDSDYANLTVVQNGTAYAIPVGVFYWDAGVQMPLMVEFMAKMMYPDYFEDVDLVTDLKDFYQEFYRYELTDEQAEMILANEDPS